MSEGFGLEVCSSVRVTGLFIYPVKSCAGIAVDRLELSERGITGDRRYMVVSPDGAFITQRQVPAMAWIQPSWVDGCLQLSFPDHGSALASDGANLEVQVWRDRVLARDCGDSMAVWLSTVLKRDARLVVLPEERERPLDVRYARPGESLGFADGFPLLVVSESSLACLSREVGRDIGVLRFRPNVVVSGGPDGYEELRWQSLATENGGRLDLVKPCERCVIPTRHPVTQVREDDVLKALKNQCLIDGRFIFGQNAIARALSVLHVDQRLAIVRSEPGF